MSPDPTPNPAEPCICGERRDEHTLVNGVRHSCLYCECEKFTPANVCRFEQGYRMMAAAVLMTSRMVEDDLQPYGSPLSHLPLDASSAMSVVGQLEEQILRCASNRQLMPTTPPFSEWLLAAAILYSRQPRTADNAERVVMEAALLHQGLLRQFANELQKASQQ